MNLGGIYKDLGELDKALNYTKKSIELNPVNAGAYINLGVIYKDIGKLNTALSYTLKAVELDPENLPK